MNARFWIWVNNGPVKITLKPKQTLHHTTGGPTDEGYHYEQCMWTHHPEHSEYISCAVEVRSKDCDGRFVTFRVDACSLINLRCFTPEDRDYVNGKVVYYPEWMKLTDNQHTTLPRCVTT